MKLLVFLEVQWHKKIILGNSFRPFVNRRACTYSRVEEYCFRLMKSYWRLFFPWVIFQIFPWKNDYEIPWKLFFFFFQFLNYFILVQLQLSAFSRKLFFCFIIFRESTETRITEVEVERTAYLRSSQNEVLNTKPDYQKILQSQNKVFDCMELLVSWVMFIFGWVIQLCYLVTLGNEKTWRICVMRWDKYT